MESIIVKMARRESKRTFVKFLKAIGGLIVLPFVLLIMWAWHGMYLLYAEVKSFLTQNKK